MKLSSIHFAGLAEVLFTNLINDYGFVIGRADKRYTLWKYRKEDDNIIIAFVHVLSDRRSRVETQYPGIYICEELRGEHRMVISRRAAAAAAAKAAAPKTVFDFAEIPFGNFSGIKIHEASLDTWVRFANSGNFKWTDAYGTEFDFEELAISKCIAGGCQKIAGKWYTPAQLINPKLWLWLANTTNDPEAKAMYESMCKVNSCQKMMGRWFMPTATDEEKPWVATARQILPKIENNEPFEFVPHFNGNDFFFGIPVKFREEDKKDVYTYYGSSHMLYVTNKKGVKVAKRTKGKTIEVLEYEVLTEEMKPYVLVTKFNIK